MKEDFFSKFKDYNKELEKIVENKGFSENTKNLLLSMFYKLETSYNDYFTVKRKVKTKQEYLEEILDNIKNSNSITLIKSNDKEFVEIKEKDGYEIDLKLKKVKAVENEFSLLSALLELNNFQINLTEKYNLIRNSFPYLLNTAHDIENIEVLRDFNAWSWNTLTKEIKDIKVNLIYQTLKFALGLDVFYKIQKEQGYIDIVEIIDEKLTNDYSEEIKEKFLKIIFKLSILIFINISENERKRLFEEKELIEKELTEIKDKKKYIERVTNDKKVLTKQLRQIDLTLNNKELLLEEYEKRNAVRSEFNKIFSLSHLAEKLQKERNNVLNKIDICNQNIEPKKYLENRKKLQSDFDLLDKLELYDEDNIYKNILKLQKSFLKMILHLKLENCKTSEEIIEFMYEFRYYIFLPYNERQYIKDINILQQDINNIEEKLIKKLYEIKAINTISTNEANDIKIVKNIFELRIINMQDIYFELKKKEKEYILLVYDEKETLEKEIPIDLVFDKKDKVKINKKIKLFI